MDSSSFNNVNNSINKVDKVISGFAGNSIKQFALAGTAVTTFFVAANIGMAKFMEGLAKSDLENEKFARRMWMSKENATAYKNVMSALGAELQDLYLSPELLQRYTELRKQANQLVQPKEFTDQMKQIRDVTFEFQRFKLEATYAMKWVGYYLFKYLEKPISDFKKHMKALNDSITIKMPHWTKQVAQFVSWFARLGIAGAWGIKRLLEALDELSPKTKVAGSAFLGFFALLKMGPIGWLIAGVTALLLLMDDFKTYQEGGDSLFGNTWKELEKLKQSMEDDGTIESFRTSLDSISNSLENILKDLGSIADKIATSLGFDDFADMLKTGVLGTLQTLDIVLNSIADALEVIDSILSADKSTGEKINNFAEGVVDNTFNPIAGFENENSWARKLMEKRHGKEVADQAGEDYKAFYSWVKDTRQDIKDWFSGLFVKHADGGIQTKPHYGLVAEDGPEAIIPLSTSRRNNALGLLAQTAGLLGVPMTGNVSNVINNYNVTNSPKYSIYGSEPTSTARAIDRTYDYGKLIRNLRGPY